MAENVLYSTDGKVLQLGVWKCVMDGLLKMSYKLAYLAEISLHSNVASVTKKRCRLDT